MSGQGKASTESESVKVAKEILRAAGYVVLKSEYHRRARECQRIAEVRCADAREQMAFQDRWWRETILPELFRYRDRCEFLYGAARAAGCSVSELHQRSEQKK